MIEIAEVTALMIYLIVTIGGIALIWLKYHLQSRKKKINLSQFELHRCVICQFVYLDQREKMVTKCPECASYGRREETIVKNST